MHVSRYSTNEAPRCHENGPLSRRARRIARKRLSVCRQRPDRIRENRTTTSPPTCDERHDRRFVYRRLLGASRRRSTGHLCDGNLGPTIALDSLSEIPHLYAIGPISGLRGEITIYDSDVSIATIRGDAPHVTSTMDEKAIFLVWASADEWTTVRIPRSLTGLGELEAFVRTAARENGLSLAQPFQIGRAHV